MYANTKISKQTLERYAKHIFLLVVLLIGTVFTPYAHTVVAQPAQQYSEIGPQMIQFSEPAVGVCYPWLVLEHIIINLPTGTPYSGIGGDSAVAVYCGDDYFAVRGTSGVYVFRMNTGTLYRAVFLSGALRFVDFKHDYLAVYDTNNGVVYVSNIKADSDVAIRLSSEPMQISFDVVDGLPIVVYSTGAPGSATYVLASPGGELQLGYVGTGAVAIAGDTVYLESGGIRVLRVTSTSYREVDFIPLPFRITSIPALFGGLMVVESYGVLAVVDVNPLSSTYKTFRVIGEAVITPVGYYVPKTDTSYVVLSNRFEPVPGYAVGVFGDVAAFTNMAVSNGSSTTSVLYPFRTTVFITTTELRGVLYSGKHAIAVTLPPGRYVLPRGTALSIGAKVVLLNSDILTYPEPARTSAEANVVPAVTYYTAEFPVKYVPLDTISNARGVYTGNGYALIIRDTDAVVYGPYGALATIPGIWFFGGIGDCVVLYDGNLRLYDFAGNPITSYLYYVPFVPDYVTCVRSGSDYLIEMYVGSIKYTMGPKGSTADTADIPRYRDPGGFEVIFTVPPRISAGWFALGLPQDASDIHINKLRAVWRTASGVYILSAPDGAIFVLVNAPASRTFYPLEDYVLMYDPSRGIVEVLPYKSWFVGGCYIDLVTDSDADVYVNNKYFGTGSTRIYMPCGSVANVKAVKPYHKPAESSVRVQKPTTLTLYPTPIIANVVLDVIAPKNLTISAVVLRIDGVQTVWSVGEVKQLLAKPYSIEVVEFKPADICRHYAFNYTFAEGDNRLTITCELTSPVLALQSSVPAVVKVYTAGVDVETGVPLSVAELTPNTIRYAAVSPGSYTVVSEPAPGLQGYVRKIINVTIPDVRVVLLDVTPAQYGRLIVEATVPTAMIEVYSEESTITGIGRLEAMLPPGTYFVRVTAPNYRPYMATVEVKPGEATTVTAVLLPMQTTPVPQQESRPSLWGSAEFQIIAIVASVAAAAFALWFRRRRKEKEVPETEVG